MLLLLPYRTDAFQDRWPWANQLLLIALAAIHAALFVWGGELPEALVLQGWAPSGLLGSMFLHADWMHLAGNLVFLWVFGNAVAARLGNLVFLALFLLSGLAAAAAHAALSDAPAVGASGAINGVVGAYLVLFPRTRVSMLWLLLYRAGTFQVRSSWLLGSWFCLDLLGALLGAAGVAYLSHVGGFAFGFLVAAGLAWAGRVRFEPVERPLFGGPRPEPEPRTRTPAAAPPGRPARTPRPAPSPPPAVPAPAVPPPPLPEAGPDGLTLTCACGRGFQVSARLRGGRTVCPACLRELQVPVEG